MHLGEPIFIFILAFVLLGPKKTSELARQVGKLMAEFRKASNDFKYQFNEEMRVADQQEQQRKQEAERAALGTGVAAPLVAAENTILPPAAGQTSFTGPPVAEPVPYAVSAVSATTGEETPIEDHPLLRVDIIPPMEAQPSPAGNGALTPEPDEAPVHRG